MASLAATGMDISLVKTYTFWAALLIVKMIAMAVFTGIKRVNKKAFANPEDARKMNAKVELNDPDVERVRRAHLNDLENILPWLALCPLYLSTGPSAWIAANLIRAFAIARIGFSFFYLNEMSLRGPCFMISTAIMLFMAGSTLLSCCSD